jgi:exodeoxyribonuclease VII small subunit
MTEATETDFSDRQSLSYARAVEELEAILGELEDDNLDVDRLTERVGRAATLIRLCRERIGATRLEVERIVADLDGAVPTPPPEEETPYRQG